MTIKVAVYGVGTMGAEVARMLLERDVRIVAAIARSPQKVGRDLGEVIGIDREVGVVVTANADEALAQTRPDVVVLTLNSFLADHAPYVERAVRAGANVITIAEEATHPWRTTPGETARLDALAKEHGVSIFGGGHEDAFWVGLGVQLAGVAHRIDSIRWESTWNPDTCGPEILASMGIGNEAPASTTTVDWEENMSHPPFALPALDAVADHLGLPDAPRTVTTEYILADTPTWSWALDRKIEVGQVIGLRDIVRREPANPGEPLLEFGVAGILAPGIHNSGESWEIKGIPSLSMRTSFSEGSAQVTSQVVNRLSDVVAAAPGWVKHSDLPAIRFQGVWRV